MALKNTEKIQREVGTKNIKGVINKFSFRHASQKNLLSLLFWLINGIPFEIQVFGEFCLMGKKVTP